MPTDPKHIDTLVVSQEAREAALASASASLGERIDLAAMKAGKQDDHPLVQAFASNRLAAEQREREAVVAWLRSNEKRKAREGLKTTRANEISCLSMQGAYGMAADAIERGDHRKEAANRSRQSHVSGRP